MKWYLVFAFVQFIIRGYAAPCERYDFGYGSIACRCNATYCDTVDENNKQKTGYVNVYSTTRSGDRLTKRDGQFTKQYGPGSVYTVDTNTTYQEIIGFGGAFTDSTGINIASLSPGAQDNLLKSYFSKQGIEYNIGRIPMASCDFSTHIYSYDDTPGDFTLANFSLAMEDHKYKIPLIKKAQKLSTSEILLFGSPWGAPAWMKTNENMVGGGYLKGKPGGEYYQTWAMYFVRFLEEYAANNITLWGVTTENEPTEGEEEHYTFQCLGFTAETQRDFVAQNLGPTLEKHGFKHIKIMILDDQRLMLPEWAKTVLDSSIANKYVSGIAIHWYMDFFTPPFKLEDTHNAFPDKFIFGSEACEHAPIRLGEWRLLESYAHDIIQDLSHWVTGWTDWNMALDPDGGPTWVKNFVNSPIIVDKEKDVFYKQTSYYAMGHFSKFLPRGSKRIKLTSDKEDLLETVAFLTPDNAVVLIVHNIHEKSGDVNIKDPSIEGVLRFHVPAKSLHTYIWWH